VGKTYTAAVFAEELLKARRQVVIVDPIGVWHGLRSSADGKRPGLPIVVMGGEHGDVPLEVSAGTTVAEFVVEQRASVVIDLSRFRKGEQVRFMTDFAETLYHKNRAPVTLIVDEADAFAPQRPQPGEQRLLGAMEDLVRRGRARGLGLMLVTQRAAVLNKNVLTQVEVLIVLRTIAPQDRDAIEAWVNVYGTAAQRDELMASLPGLAIGEAWFWSPGWLELFQRVHVRARETFDSSATPKAGDKIAAPKTRAEVDLDALKVKIAATIEKAKADDPRELRKQIAELKAQLSKGAHLMREKGQTVEKPVLTDADRALLVRIEESIRNVGGLIRTEFKERIDDFTTAMLTAIDRQPAAFTRLVDGKGFQKVLDKLAVVSPQPSSIHPTATTAVPRSPLARRVAPPSAPATSGRPARQVSDGGLARAEHAILTAAVQRLPKASSRAQLAVLSGYSIKSSSFSNALGALRSRGLMVGTTDDNRATEAGVEALGAYEPMPTGAALIAHWMGQLGKAERALLEVLTKHYPSEVPKDVLSQESGYSETSSSFSNALGKLRTLELVRGLRASEELFS
jgi:hypothetical protein